MIEAGDVKARVVDIRRRQAPIPSRIAVDTNVLHFWYYPNFRDLWRFEEVFKAPVDKYQPFQAALLRNGSRIYTCRSIYGEFVNTMETADLEILRRSDQTIPAPDQVTGRDRKNWRFRYRDGAAVRRKRICDLAKAAIRVVNLLPNFTSADAACDSCAAAWCGGFLDFEDAALVASAAVVGLNDFLTHDADFVTVAGKTVYTANGAAVDLARRAGKLINP